MPRASWNGFLRLSLVTCPVYLVPATSEAKRVRFNQLNAETGNRVAQQLVDSKTGDPVDRDQIVKGYEYERGRYVTITDDELKDLQIESSKIIDLDRFVDRDEVDPIYLDTPYYIYPDGELAAETFRVIGEAMAKQARELAYVSSASYTNLAAVQLGDVLAGLTPGDLDRFFICSGGSEAIESAMKIAKQVQAMRGFPKRYKIIARRGGYHGATFGAMSIT